MASLRKSFPNGFIENEIIYRTAWAKHPVRKIGIVKDIDFSIKYFESKFKYFENHVDTLAHRISHDENKGSFLNKAKHLKASLPTLNGLGDFQALDNKISYLIEIISTTVITRRVKNEQIKAQLIRQIIEATDIVNWPEATAKILSIKKIWINTGPTEKLSEAHLNEEFKSLLNSFFDQKKAFYDDKKELNFFYERKYEALIQEAKKLQNLDEDQITSKLESLKIAWKENGVIKKNKYDELKKEFDRVNNSKKVNHSLDQVLTLIHNFKLKKEVTESALIKYRAQLASFNKKNYSSPKFNLLLAEGYEWLDLSEEILFVEGLCPKKNIRFHEKSIKEQIAMKVQIIHKLLKRDQADLKTLEDNSVIFNSKNSYFSEMVAKKIKFQKTKIEVKMKLLSKYGV